MRKNKKEIYRLQNKVLAESYIHVKIKKFKNKRDNLIREGNSSLDANKEIYTLMSEDASFVNALTGGLFSGVKSDFARGIISNIFGIDSNSFFGKFLINVVENVGLNQIFALMGKEDADSCDAIVELFSKATLETVTEMGADKVLAFMIERFGEGEKAGTILSDTKVKEVTDSLIAAIGIEVINEFLYKFIFETYVNDISQQLCSGEISLGDLVNQMKLKFKKPETGAGA